MRASMRLSASVQELAGLLVESPPSPEVAVGLVVDAEGVTLELVDTSELECHRVSYSRDEVFASPLSLLQLLTIVETSTCRWRNISVRFDQRRFVRHGGRPRPNVLPSKERAP